MNDPQKKVSFVFYCFEKESADLKIRLRYDGLGQTEFFAGILKMYISQDPLVLDVVERIKSKGKKMGKNRLKNTRKDYERSKKLESSLKLTEEEREELFDVIQEEVDL